MAIPKALKTLKDRLDQAVASTPVPAASIAVYHEGEVYSAASGILSRASGVEATTEALFNMGSVTKLFTATQIMQLVEQGSIELDMPYQDYVPEFQLKNTKAASSITIRQLLCHTNGLYGDYFKDTGRNDDALKRYVDDCRDISAYYTPGALFSYSNCGYALLGRLIEKIKGQSWNACLRQTLLKPLGIERAAFLPEEKLPFRSAFGHWVTGLGPDDYTLATEPNFRSTGPSGSGLAMTPAELLKFAHMHMSSGKSETGMRILSEETVRQMQEVQVPLPFHQKYQAWCLGWMRYRWGAQEIIGHDGGNAGMSCNLRIFKDRDAAFAFAANGGNAGALVFRALLPDLMRELWDVELPQPATPDPDLTLDLANYVGTYRRYGMEIDLKLQDGGLIAVVSPKDGETNVPDGTEVEFKPVSREYFNVELPMSASPMEAYFLEFDEDGRPQFLNVLDRAMKRMNGDHWDE